MYLISIAFSKTLRSELISMSSLIRPCLSKAALTGPSLRISITGIIGSPPA